MTDRAKAHRKALVPRVTKRARVADTFKSFSFNINDQNSDQGLNSEMVHTVDELVNTCPPLHRATASLCADVFGISQQLALEDADGNMVDLAREKQAFLDEYWLPVLQKACKALVLYGIAALETMPLKHAGNQRSSVFMQRARAERDAAFRPFVEEIALKQQVPKLLPVEKIRLSENGDHYVLDHPNAFVFESLTPPDANGNLCTTASCAAHTFAFVNTLCEANAHAWTSLSAPSIVVQKRHGPSGGAMDSSALFFDTQSKLIHHDDLVEGEARNIEMFKMLQAQCVELNRLQTSRVTPFGQSEEKSKDKKPKHDYTVVPPEQVRSLSPSVFVCAN